MMMMMMMWQVLSRRGETGVECAFQNKMCLRCLNSICGDVDSTYQYSESIKTFKNCNFQDQKLLEAWQHHGTKIRTFTFANDPGWWWIFQATFCDLVKMSYQRMFQHPKPLPTGHLLRFLPLVGELFIALGLYVVCTCFSRCAAWSVMNVDLRLQCLGILENSQSQAV